MTKESLIACFLITCVTVGIVWGTMVLTQRIILKSVGEIVDDENTEDPNNV